VASTIKVDTIQSTTSNVFVLNSAGTEYARFDSDGDLGIGITSPVVKLDVAGTTNIRHTYTGASGGILFGQYNITGDAQIQNQSSGGIIALATNNTERMRITPTGNVGIGTTNPLAKLNVVDNTNSCNMYIGYSGGGGTNYLQSNVATYFTNSTGATFHATINPYGIGVGSATPTSGFGIAFPATQSASSDANTLDDYEEGTWTPVIISSGGSVTATYSRQQGKYVKIGSMVYISGSILTGATATTPAGISRLGGLPFTSGNSNGEADRTTFTMGYVQYTASSVNQPRILLLNANNVVADFYRADGADARTGQTTTVSQSEVNGSGVNIYFSGTYFTPT
jgi:hypothetical protein